jgi:hypothetical protein
LDTIAGQTMILASMNTDQTFYSTVAQFIPVLLLAAGFQIGLTLAAQAA